MKASSNIDGLSICLVSVLLAVAIGCSDGSGTPIHFIIPDGFKGKVDITLDSQNGVALTEHEGRFVCLIPTNGQLRVKSLNPFQAWHVETASFANGTQILPLGSSPVSMFSLGSYASSSADGTNSAQGVTYFVGTRSEADEFKY